MFDTPLVHLQVHGAFGFLLVKIGNLAVSIKPEVARLLHAKPIALDHHP